MLCGGALFVLKVAEVSSFRSLSVSSSLDLCFVLFFPVFFVWAALRSKETPGFNK